MHREAGGDYYEEYEEDDGGDAYNEYDDDDDDDDREPYCYGCRRWFSSLEGLDQHLSTSSRHNWCFECSKDFSSPHALQQVRCVSPQAHRVIVTISDAFRISFLSTSRLVCMPRATSTALFVDRALSNPPPSHTTLNPASARGRPGSIGTK